MRVFSRPDRAEDFTINRTRITAGETIRKLKTAERLIAQGKTVVEVCRVIEVAQRTYHRWRQKYGGMQAEDPRRLTQLEKENARLIKPQMGAKGNTFGECSTDEHRIHRHQVNRPIAGYDRGYGTLLPSPQ